MIKPRAKNNTATILGYVSACGALVATGYTVLSGEKPISIWAAFGLFYITYKYSVKSRGNPQLSLLAVWLILVGALSFAFGLIYFFAALAEGFSFTDLILFALFPVGAIHILVGYWAYQNLDDKSFKGSFRESEQQVDYEVINFTKVRELVTQVDNGNFDILNNGAYRSDISDAAIQAISERTLFKSLKLIYDSIKDQGKLNEHFAEKYLLDLVAELEDDSLYQLYPLFSNEESYLEYFYFEDVNFRRNVQKILAKVDSRIELNDFNFSSKLKKSYFENCPCAKHWPVIAKYL